MIVYIDKAVFLSSKHFSLTCQEYKSRIKFIQIRHVNNQYAIIRPWLPIAFRLALKKFMA